MRCDRFHSDKRLAAVRKFHAYERSEVSNIQNLVRTKYSRFTEKGLTVTSIAYLSYKLFIEHTAVSVHEPIPSVGSQCAVLPFLRVTLIPSQTGLTDRVFAGVRSAVLLRCDARLQRHLAAHWPVVESADQSIEAAGMEVEDVELLLATGDDQVAARTLVVSVKHAH